MKLYGQCRFAPCSETERLLVRHGLESIWRGKLYRESYAPRCWLNPGEPVPFRLTHDGETIGHVIAVAASGQWHHASFMIEDPTPEVRERVKVGARVSLAAQSLQRYEDTEPNVVRHTLVRLEEIALVEVGAVAGFIGARITDLRELTAQPEPPVRTTVPLEQGELITTAARCAATAARSWASGDFAELRVLSQRLLSECVPGGAR